MAQEPFGDARSQQQWHPQGPADWQVGGSYGQQLQDPQQPQEQAHWQQQAGYGSLGYGQQPSYDQAGYGQPGYDQPGYGQAGYDRGGYQGGHDQGAYGQTGYVEGGYVHGPGPYGGQEQYQPYPGHSGHGHSEYAGYPQQFPQYADQQQPYAPYPSPQEPAGEGLYVPAGAEYSADGYVHIEEAEPEPAPSDPEETSERAAESAAGPGAARSRSAGRRGGDSGSGPGSASGSASGSSFSAKARKAADAVLTGEHVPSRKALLVRAGAGVAALGVLVAAGLMVGAEGGGSAAASSGGEPGFAVAHTRAWSAQPAATGQPAGDDTLVGSWLLADAVVRADGSGVHAYDRAGGKPTWSVEPPAAGAVPCGLSAGINQAGLGAVLFRPQADPKSPCVLVAAVDTKNGKTAWTKSVSEAKGAYSARIGVTEDKVIAIGDDRAVAWASADGADVWQYTGQGRFCTLSGGVSGKTVLVASSCADSTPADQAVALNTADGKVGWWRGLNNQPKTVTVLSAEPAVVLTTGDKPENDRVFAWGAAGDPAAEIPVVTGGGRLDVAHGAFAATPEVFFEGRTMVTTLTPANGGGPVAAVGYDLDTGKQRWKTPTTVKGTVRAVGIDGGSLVLAADERRDQPARLSRFPLVGGQEATGGNFPAGTGSLLVSGRVLIGGGQVVVVPEHSTNYGTAAGYQAKG
ncbi:outer membrane protein assembly factor BamB family protein [Streptomyces sp. 1331.2]|uniref:outer membrane protein assembly factor BamB family protein n=1 Tax=Streptomyces sp. 1331.2 TaxID=1938835 RepID=UPI000BCE89CE|nr:PQQ-binding-like beta-propeller repeat protein [Streptomyces sp. 1331.2]SOB81430.1 PQQ-like domain-containing protein [Streptomyces sp. 1331.2]